MDLQKENGPAASKAINKSSQEHNTTATEENQICKTAINLLNQGFSVIPAWGKVPFGSWTAYQHSQIDPKSLKAFLEHHANANIGIATGKFSGIFVVDIDGLEGEESLRRLEYEYGQLPPTVEVISGGDGRHIYFKYPERGRIKTTAGQVAPHIDIRGEGGFIICPPSIHPSGRKYEWSVDCTLEIATAPTWLLKLAKGKSAKSKSPPQSNEWLELIKNGVKEGGRNTEIARLSGMLLRKGIDPYVTLELCQAWNESRCTPPLEQAEIFTTVNSIAGAESNRRQGVKNNG